MNQFVNLVVTPARIAMGYGHALLGDVTPELFRRVPEGVSMSSPAFVYGHLASYPNRVMSMWGMTDRLPMEASTEQRYAELFGMGKECVDDPAGEIYPEMEALVGVWRRGYEALLEAAGDVPESVLSAENPNERMRERFPTIGAASSFMLNGHQMMHFGQVSGWRRVMGLGPCM